jgi:hypothetical protein
MPPKPPRLFVASPATVLARASDEGRAIHAREKAVWDAWVGAGGDVREFAGK